MKFGVFFLLGSPQMLPAEEIYRRTFTQVELAEALGFDSVWFAEHHFSNYGFVPNPLMLAGTVGRSTSRVRIGTAVLVLPFWHPLRVAEDIATADQLCGGRLDVGVARGYQPYEFARFGLSQDESRERTDETLEILLLALTQESFSFDGRYYSIPETTIFPRPLQRPHPPIWLAAHTRESFAIAVRLGLKAITTNSARPIAALQEGWQAFQTARRQAGQDGPTEFAVQAHVIVGRTDDEARELTRHSLYAFRQVASLRAGRQHIVNGYSEPHPVIDEPSLDELFANRTLSGSPATVRAKLERFRAVCGMTALNCTFQLGSMEPETVQRSMRLFAEEVMPAFRSQPIAAGTGDAP
ncbi:MAG TPA: LLM class flavin-dependent oxidoreductase [Dehalococcoidia bacterium]|jgi:alkanesulfonate monooxygenase SsuD/methylene tetrahydromethanopterin reductase-like flavin-dependent oxidoreductase (luciferase family)